MIQAIDCWETRSTPNILVLSRASKSVWLNLLVGKTRSCLESRQSTGRPYRRRPNPWRNGTPAPPSRRKWPPPSSSSSGGGPSTPAGRAARGSASASRWTAARRSDAVPREGRDEHVRVDDQPHPGGVRVGGDGQVAADARARRGGRDGWSGHGRYPLRRRPT